MPMPQSTKVRQDPLHLADHAPCARARHAGVDGVVRDQREGLTGGRQRAEHAQRLAAARGLEARRRQHEPDKRRVRRGQPRAEALTDEGAPTSNPLADTAMPETPETTPALT